ncbi:diaminopimelate epimerase [Gammaproteobacteria bacterium]|nr:diaminopimelate epimerase [Gammaproteobacteria bacterium]
MLLRFTKMHGLGNDFMVVDLISQHVSLNPELIKELSDRRFGIGFDQLLTVRPPQRPDSDFRYTIYNADGSEAEQCGNGARCLLRFVRDQGLTSKSTIRLETSNANISCKLEKDGNITVDMGKPALQPGKIPFVAENQQTSYDLSLRPKYPDTFSISVLNVGNPHAVITVPAVDSAPVLQVGPLIESHSRFPEGVNVGFMEVVSSKKIRLRVFERGVGETNACGSGACAAVVAGRLQGLLDATVNVQLAGGHMSVTWGGKNESIKMTGPACKIYEGQLQI